jgi:transposase InsO family protein
MSRVASPTTGRVYGIAQTCRIWGIGRATVYRHRHAGDGDVPRRRPGPQGTLDDTALVERIRDEIQSSPFHGEGYRKIWARLRFSGVRTTAKRVRRLMGEHGLLAPHRIAPPRDRPHDGTIVTDRVDTMWGTDMTQTVTTQAGRAYVFVAIDHCSGEVVGIHAAERATRFEALEPIRQGVRRNFGGFDENIAQGLSLRHDHGSNYMAHDFQDEIAFLGIEASPSFIRQPEGNGVAERFIRTLKENCLWVETFATIEDLRLGLRAFADRYNAAWMVAKHGYKTPNQVRAEQSKVENSPVKPVALAA